MRCLTISPIVDPEMTSLLQSVSEDVIILDFEQTKILHQDAVDTIGAELQNIARTTEMKKIVVDMNRIELMTSSMIGQFVSFHKQCQARGINISFCNLTKQIKELFKITKLDTMFQIKKNREDAMKGL